MSLRWWPSAALPRACCVAGLLLLACRSEPQPPSAASGAAPPRRGGTIVLAAGSDVQGFNELLASDQRSTADVLEQLFLRLFEEQPDYEQHPPTMRPLLAESYQWSEDRKTLTVHLRPGVSWSDGTPLTADDVLFTWQAQTAKEVAWNYSFVKDAIAAVEVVDPLTVRYRFREVYATQLLDVNEGFILPRHAWKELPFAEWRKRGDWFREHLVTDGPFRLAAWSPAQELVLEPNPRYFEPGLPRLGRVVIRVIPDQANQLAQLEAGSVDFVQGVPPSEAGRLRSNSHLQLLTFWNRQYDYIAWNTKNPLFADPEVRRALTLAIDRQAMIDAIWHGYARPSCSPILSSVWAHNAQLAPWPYDPQEARRIFAAKGWKERDGILTRDGKRFSFELSTNASNRIRTDATVMIQAQLAKVGIEAKPLVLDANALTERNLAHRFDATLSGWAIDTALDLRAFFHSAEADGGYNFGSYANPEVDRLIDQVRRERDLAAAKPLFDRLQEILHREQPYTFLWEPQRICAARQEVRDARPNALEVYFNLHEWWLAATAR